MNIGKAADLSGLTVKAVRYYANIGLVVPLRNKYSGYRNYSEKDVNKLIFIGKARKFDFSIQECRSLLFLYEDNYRTSRAVKEITDNKLKEIDERLILLKSLRNELFSLSSSCKGDDTADCPIIKNLSDNTNNE